MKLSHPELNYELSLITSRTRRRSDQHLLDTFKERRLINFKNIIHIPRSMTRRKLLRPQMRPPQIRTIKRRINIHIRLHGD